MKFKVIGVVLLSGFSICFNCAEEFLSMLCSRIGGRYA